MAPIPRHSDLIGMGCELAIRIIKNSPTDSNVQQSSRTTTLNNRSLVNIQQVSEKWILYYLPITQLISPSISRGNCLPVSCYSYLSVLCIDTSSFPGLYSWIIFCFARISRSLREIVSRVHLSVFWQPSQLNNTHI